MATTSDGPTRLSRPPDPTWRHGFAFGTPAARGASFSHAIVVFLDLFRRDHRDERAALAPTLGKLVVWIVAAVAATSAGAVLLGALAVRIWSRAFG